MGSVVQYKPAVAAYVYTQHLGSEGRRSEVQDHPWLHSELEVSLGYM